MPLLPVGRIRAAVVQQQRELQAIAMAAGVFLLSCTGVACKESLPPYVEPHSLFAGSLVPEYRWTRLGSTLWVHINVCNTFDETLQGRQRMTGTLTIVLKRDPRHFRTVTLTSDHVVNSSGVTRQGDQVTIGRGDTLKLVYVWDFRDDDGCFLPTDVFHAHGEPGFPDILLSDPELLVLKGSFQVFDKAGQLTFQPLEYLLTYYY